MWNGPERYSTQSAANAGAASKASVRIRRNTCLYHHKKKSGARHPIQRALENELYAKLRLKRCSKLGVVGIIQAIGALQAHKRRSKGIGARRGSGTIRVDSKTV